MITEITTTQKLIWYVWAVWIFEYLWIKEIWFYVLTILMITDTITWISKQFIINKNDITSHRMIRWILKKVFTIMFLFSFALMFKWLWYNWDSYINAVLSVLIVAEFYSITQNIYSFRTWKQITEYDAVSYILKYIWEQLIKVIEKHLWKKE